MKNKKKFIGYTIIDGEIVSMFISGQGKFYTLKVYENGVLNKENLGEYYG